MAKNRRQTLKAVSDPLLTTSKKIETSVLQPQRDEFFQQSKEAWKQILP